MVAALRLRSSCWFTDTTPRAFRSSPNATIPQDENAKLDKEIEEIKKLKEEIQAAAIAQASD